VVALYYADAQHWALVREEAARAIRLTTRERECLLWLAKGLRNDRISERMGISNPTVEMHLAHARQKLGASTREQALAKAVALRLISP
jgi:DNA-binding CsgD family transcriptional regulator